MGDDLSEKGCSVTLIKELVLFMEEKKEKVKKVKT